MFCGFFRRLCFFFNDTATTEIYTLSLHDALPISSETIDLPLTTSRTPARVAMSRTMAHASAASPAQCTTPPLAVKRCSSWGSSVATLQLLVEHAADAQVLGRVGCQDQHELDGGERVGAIVALEIDAQQVGEHAAENPRRPRRLQRLRQDALDVLAVSGAVERAQPLA